MKLSICVFIFFLELDYDSEELPMDLDECTEIVTNKSGEGSKLRKSSEDNVAGDPENLDKIMPLRLGEDDMFDDIMDPIDFEVKKLGNLMNFLYFNLYSQAVSVLCFFL